MSINITYVPLKWWTAFLISSMIGLSIFAQESKEAPPIEDSFLNGVEGREKLNNDSPGLLVNKPKTRLRWVKKHGLWFNYGLGYSTAGFKRPIRDLVLGYDRLFFDAMEMGLYGRLSTLTHVDTVTFENTPYTENRTYEISSLLLGPHIRYRLEGQLGMIAGAGVSLLQSKLKGVTTDAPLPSSLNVGETTSFPLDIGYDIGLYYREKLGPFRVGAEIGYTVNSVKPENAIGEIYFVLHIEAYVRGIVSEVIEETPAAPGAPAPPENPAPPEAP